MLIVWFYSLSNPVDYDVIIVGSGPAGLSTARTVAKSGLRCLVVDRVKEIGFPVRTSGASWIDELTILGVPSSCYHVVSTISLIGPTQEATFYREKPVGCIIDITSLNQFLASEAKKLSAEIRLGCKVTNVLRSGKFVNGIELVDDGHNEKLSCKVVVDASGASAVIPRKLGLLQSWSRLALGVQYDVESSSIDPNWLGLYMGNCFIPSGYGWFFPWKKNRARVGLGIIRPDSYANPLLFMDDFLKNDKLPKIKDNYSIVGKEVGVFPSAGPLKQMVADGFVAVGDSVGQGSPLHGEGIRYAIKFGVVAGNIICKAIETGNVSRKGLYSYEEIWRNEEGKNFRVALEVQKRISKHSDAQWDRSIRFIKQIGEKNPEIIIQLFKTNFSYSNLWQLFKESPIRAVRYLSSSV